MSDAKPQANPEQRKAIQHSGGVLLEAGAGSGKTFVLVEHVVYLLEELAKQSRGLTGDDLKKEISGKLNKMVVMTFTKKAAGELALRLKSKFKEVFDGLDLNDGDGEYLREFWQYAVQGLDDLTVTTIHGFCYKLLRQGFFIDVDPELSIISDGPARERIQSLYKNWLSPKLQNNTISADQFMLSTFLANEKQLVTSLFEVFSDPGIRLTWKDMDLDEVMAGDIAKYFDNIFELLGIDSAFELFDLSRFNEFDDKKWYLYLKAFETQKLKKISNWDDYKGYQDFFASYGRVQKPRSNLGLHAVEDYFLEIRKLRDFVKKYSEDFEAFFAYKNQAYFDWISLFKDAFDYIDSRYFSIPGAGFGDLEYLVAINLRQPESRAKVLESYNYFIVDEFQDTSHVQFQIIEDLIGGDFEKLFCVGDVKQAIYGFRGGELAVFLECQKKVREVLTLTNNYRSAANVIDINNKLFSHIIPKGLGFKGLDRNPIPVVHQKYPFGDEGAQGLLQRFQVEIAGRENGDKYSVSQVNFYEAMAIIDIVKKIWKDEPNEHIAILYSKLTPTKFLLPLLIQAEIGFSSQVKIPFGEDPIIGIFKALIDAKLNERGRIEYASLMIVGYLHLLGVEISYDDSAKMVGRFYKDCLIVGVMESFRKMIFAMEISNSNYVNNMTYIEDLCLVGKNDFSSIWQLFSEYSDNKYKFEFQYGSNSEKLVIMTAHASKGLEFSTVILGGIHTNGRSMIDLSYFGKMPGSFKWKAHSNQKKPFLSPNLILERAYQEQKEFAESKRLFYVAATRAKNSLVWLDYNFTEDQFRYPANSWFVGLQSWIHDMDKDSLALIKLIEEQTKKISIDMELSDDMLAGLNNMPPLFHKDCLGIQQRDSFVDARDVDLGTVAELSVTRLAVICECPRKFYLVNICKMDERDISLLKELCPDRCCDSNSRNDELSMVEMHEEDRLQDEGEGNTNRRFFSSAQRGTRIHDYISESILKNFVLPRDLMAGGDDVLINSLEWLMSQLKKYGGYRFVSEEAIKFSLLGFTISGIPDLILDPLKSDKIYQVWDFKTGERNSEKEQTYWFQLMVYGYSSYLLGKNPRANSVKLVLAYVDQQLLVEKEFSFEEVENCLSMEWGKLANLGQINSDHCPHCQFGNICPH